MEEHTVTGGYEPDEIALAKRLYVALLAYRRTDETGEQDEEGEFVAGDPAEYGPLGRTSIDGQFNLLWVARQLLKEFD